jgi:hypothetical protein
MKSIIAATFMLTVIASQAALIPFGVSPKGTSAAVGLSPTNEVPPLTGTGSGGAISNAEVAAIFDSTNSTLHLSIGFGSSQGFGDLTSPATTAGIFGPATTNQNAASLFDLAPLTVLATNPAMGGTISGDVVFATNDVAALLSGMDYINIATAANTNGEIRGQLIPLDIPPMLECPSNMTVTCGTEVTLTAGVSDPLGNSVTVVWSLNGMPVQTNEIPASAPATTNAPAATNSPAGTNVTFTAVLPTGTNTVKINAENAAGSEASCTTTVAEVDTNPPVFVSASPSQTSLWPPNHQMEKITISATVTDNCSSVTWKVVDIKSNEGVKAKGSGQTSPDWKITGAHSVELRAERAGNGSGRVYTIDLQAVDAFGNRSAIRSVTVTVPHDQGKGKGNDNGKGNGKGNDKDNGKDKGNGKGNSNGKGNGKK